MTPETQEKLQLLEAWFSKHQGSIVAFSGGIDSTLVLFLARKYQGKDKAIGVISNSESLKSRDFKVAQSFCEAFDIHLEVIETREIEDERYSQNPENRCYFCKEHLFRDMGVIHQKYPAFDVLSGTNRDDLGDYRPGLQAAAQYQVLAPMAECKISKDEIREIARHFNLPNWDKPASPCLSSRIPYNHRITAEKLRQVEFAETLLNEAGFVDVRVRHYGEFGQVEVHKNELDRLLTLKDELIPKIKSLGFADVKIDEEGLVSGKLNRVIKGAQTSKNTK